MRGEKTVDLGYEITYPYKGQEYPSSEITVRAPGMSMYRTHSLMQAWTIKGANGWRKAYADDIEKARKAAGDAPAVAPEKTDDGDTEVDVMAMMAAGLGDQFAEFSAFVLDTLKNNIHLASIGPADMRAPISDLVLKQIDEAEGPDGWNRVASEFTGFFMLGQPSKAKTSGADSSPPSASATKEASPTPKRVNSRLRS